MMEKLCLKSRMTQRMVRLLADSVSHRHQGLQHTLCNMGPPSHHMETSKGSVNHAVVGNCKQGSISYPHKMSKCGPSDSRANTSRSFVGTEKKMCANARWYQSVTCSSNLKQSISLLNNKACNYSRMHTSTCSVTPIFSIRTAPENLPFRQFCTDVSKNLDGKLDENSGSAEMKSSSEAIANIAKLVMTEVSKEDKMILSMPEQRVRSIVKILLDYNLSAAMIQDLLTENPGLLKGARLQQCLSLLTDYGFTSVDLAKVLKDGQSMVILKPKQIEDVVYALRKAGMKEGVIKELITEEPNVLSLVEKDIQSRISQLKAYFKTEDVVRLIVKTPVVLVCDIEEIVEKFNYAHHEMSASQRQIMYTHLFTYSLHHIKCRHLFLIRTGLFGTEKASKGSNPRLQDVIDSSDTDFVKQFGGMHVEEYLTFCKMIALSDQYEQD